MSEAGRRGASRRALHWAVPVAGAVAMWVAGSASASASVAVLTRDDGDQPGKGLSVLETVGLFVGIPLLVAVVLTVLTFAASGARGPRYRPGLTWWAEPVWIGGPQTAVSPVDRDALDVGSRLEPVGHPQLTGDDSPAPARATAAGASVASATAVAATVTPPPATTAPTGGARARW